MTRQRIVAAVTASVALAMLAWYATASRGPADEPWPAPLDDRSFWTMVQEFSEPAGSFTAPAGYRSDNLISNERSLQQVMPTLLQVRRSGAYLGVGPEQNFTYIAALEPSIAFVIDIRRENFLLHLLYKALAEESHDRADFLSRLFARPRPSDLPPGATVQAMFTAFEHSSRSATLAQATVASVIGRLTDIHGFPLTAADREGIASLLARFGEEGPMMRWDPVGDAWIPSYAELMAAADPEGTPRSYLASEAAFQVFRRYQLRNRIVPLVGNFAGARTLRSVARYLERQGAIVGVFYISNVEAYLGGGAGLFAANVAALPRAEHSVFVRTRFRWTGQTGNRPAFATTTATEPMQTYVDAWAPDLR